MKRRTCLILAILCTFIVFFESMTIPAFAYSTGDDYPNKNSCAGCHSTYYGDDHNDYNSRAFYYRQCTDFVAWCLISRNGVEGFCNSYGGYKETPEGNKWGNAYNWEYAAASLDGCRVDNTPAVGAVAVWRRGAWIEVPGTINGGWPAGYGTGHVAWVKEVNGDRITIEEYNNKVSGGFDSITISASNPSCYLHIKDISTEIIGTEMTVGYDRVLPDGDYIIAASADPRYFLDITGTALPAADHDNVALYYVDNLDSIAAADIWTITYDSSNKFYKIKQKGTDMCLDVAGAGNTAPTNVQVFHDNNDYKTHYWAISLAGEKGYRIESRSGTFSLDMSTGLGSGVNVRQWKNTESEDEKWLFIPYKPSQPVGEERYILQLARDPSFELTVSDNNNVRLWDDTASSQSNSFDLIKLSNGYYKIKHVASGKCLDVKNAAVDTNLVDVILFNDNGTLAQQWAIVENGTGYSLISRCNGYVLHLSTGDVVNGTNIDVSRWYYENNALNQRWSFAKAEHRIRYNAPEADGGIPAEQIKYYKSKLKLSEQIPTRTGYQFLYWEDLY